MIYIGIDPGQSGGIAWIDGEAHAHKMPETPHDIGDLLHRIALFAEKRATLERVSAMPKQGVSSTFKFGRNYGLLEGLLVALQIPYDFVAPSKWQGDLKCRTGGDKNITKAFAQRLFPELRITHATADALLIAEWTRRQFLYAE